MDCRRSLFRNAQALKWRAGSPRATLAGAGSVLHIHHFEALSAKNLKCAIFIGVYVNHDCAVPRLFLAGMRGDTRPLKATDTIRYVTSCPMAFTMENPNFFHAASLPFDCDVDQGLDRP